MTDKIMLGYEVDLMDKDFWSFSGNEMVGYLPSMELLPQNLTLQSGLHKKAGSRRSAVGSAQTVPERGRRPPPFSPEGKSKEGEAQMSCAPYLKIGREKFKEKRNLCCCCGLWLATEPNGLCKDCADNCAGYLLKDKPRITTEDHTTLKLLSCETWHNTKPRKFCRIKKVDKCRFRTKHGKCSKWKVDEENNIVFMP